MKTEDEQIDDDYRFVCHPNKNIRTGRIGEIITRATLKREGWTIEDTNWRCAYGEIDIIARDPTTGEIALIEVKTRTGDICGSAQEAITKRKLNKVRLLAGLWIEAFDPSLPVRVDFVGVDIAKDNSVRVHHIRGIA